MTEIRELTVLEQYVVDDVLAEHAKSGRHLREILECLRDEGHLSIEGEPAMNDCVLQCSLARTARG